MRQLLTGLSAIVLFAYPPFAVYFGMDKFGLNLVGGLVNCCVTFACFRRK